RLSVTAGSSTRPGTPTARGWPRSSTGCSPPAAAVVASGEVPARPGARGAAAARAHRPRVRTRPPADAARRRPARSPAGVDRLTELAVVDRADGVVEVGRELERARRGVGACLLGGAGPRDHRGDAVLRGDPGEGDLRRRRGGDETAGDRGELGSGPDPGLEVDARKRLADVEGGAVAVEAAVVVRGEGRVRGVATREQSAGQRDPGDDADSGLLR